MFVVVFVYLLADTQLYLVRVMVFLSDCSVVLLELLGKCRLVLGLPLKRQESLGVVFRWTLCGFSKGVFLEVDFVLLGQFG